MSKEEKFKKNLQNLLDESEFTFQESDWVAAKKVIDEQRKKRRLGAFWLVLGGILLMGGLFVLWPTLPKHEVVQVRNSVSSTSMAAEETEHSTPNNTNETKVTSKALKQKATTAVNPNLKANLASTVLSETPPPSESPLPPGTTAPSSSHTPSITVSNNNTAPPTSEVPLSFVLEPSGLPASESTTTPAIAETTSYSYTAENKNQNEEPTRDTTVTNTIEKTAALAKPAQTDSVMLPASAASQIVMQEPLKKMRWSVEAGFSVLFGWNSSNGKEGRGFNPLLGFNYHNSFTDRLDYSFGLNFTTVAHLHAFGDTSKITMYKFGEESQVTVISPRSFYYLTLPFRVQINFARQQCVGANFEFGYLLNVNSSVTTYPEDLTIGEKQSNKEMGYMEGVSPYRFGFGLFYRRELLRRFYIQPELMIGLTDLKDDAFFNSKAKESHSGLKLTLLYSFNK